MRKKYSIRFWIIFWLVAGILLVGWYYFLQVKNYGFSQFSSTTDILPVSQEIKGDIQAILSLSDYILNNDDSEKTFLLLFQNNWELRPGGGFIGSFGILKIKNGQLTSLDIHDTGNFDGRIPDTIKPPYPMEQTLGIDSWKLRDSNYSPDFPTNAQRAIEFYKLGEGSESFDGVIGITTNVLVSLLDITGPIQVPGYPGVYDSETGIYTLEHQVEKGYVNQGIPLGERKSVMSDLANAVIEKLQPINFSKKIALARVALENLEQKDIQLYFIDQKLEKIVQDRGWGGNVDALWQNDYLMVVDANLGSYKSDPLVERTVSYAIDFTTDVPTAILTLTYDHTATERDWLINHYTSYTRVYVPEDSWLTSINGNSLNNVQFEETFNKKVFGFIVNVPINTSRTYTLEYSLPEAISEEFYDLKIQKQAGINNVPYTITTNIPFENTQTYSFTVSEDLILSDIEQ